ncbi:hypothetical protein [Gillisia sp. Hel_I_29]|uniref:hypothetical protein n=1 Tax=Gillisia sp. Hel_I_29 TaxID=1249975 RepID=UPI000690163A|nr:hypothetical protein [Gillisia sp. Hel_I_29]
MSIKKKSIDTIKFLYPLESYFLEKSMEVAEILKNGDIAEMKIELEKKIIECKILELQAKTDQEFAISRRIDNAVDVEIEEFYESSGNGKIGGNASENSIGIDISGSGKKITRRIYKFKGIKDA